MVELEYRAKRLRSVVACTTSALAHDLAEDMHWYDIEVSRWDPDLEKYVAPDMNPFRPLP